MTILNALLVSLFGISVVFIVLISLSFVVKVQSFIVSYVGNKKEDSEVGCENISDFEDSGQFVKVTNGELRLIDVDEKTAAMIMAIVSDELKIPLNKLDFKAIRALD